MGEGNKTTDKALGDVMFGQMIHLGVRTRMDQKERERNTRGARKLIAHIIVDCPGGM